jgi:hypothetical protein
MTEPQARNELEVKLMDANDGRITSDELLEALFTAQVFMPVQDEKPAVLNIQRSASAKPLVLNAEDGTPVLVLFSSPERAKSFVKDYPGYGGGLLTEFTWVLEKMGRDYGIALNPGSEIGFDMEPETVNELIDALSARARH